ncbi:hypothetical protein [Embleya sp. NPDC005971]|uniref:hypothetical protein n=1 Tax=Embleya sp. NPDC005971 TaxID=3156724 RepID=UPI00340BA542
MPGQDIYAQGIAAALLSDKPDAQSLAKAIADGAAKYGVKIFTNASNRGAVLTGLAAPVAGMVTYLAAENRIDYYDGSVWQPITPGPWIPLPYDAAITAQTGSPAYRLVNGVVELRGTLRRVDGASFAKVTTITLATLPAGYRPGSFRYFPVATEFASVMYARVLVDVSGVIQANIPPDAGTAATWISLDGIRIAL